MKIQDLQNYLQGNYNYYIGLPPHQQEQVHLRIFLCEDCLHLQKCKVCNCKTPQMFYSPYKVDSQQKWAQFFTPEQWESLKNNIELYYKFFTSNDTGINTDTGSSDSTDNKGESVTGN